MSRLSLNYSCDSSLWADKSFDIGIYHKGSLIRTVNMANGANYRQDMEPGDYQIKVMNPQDYSFSYSPGEDIKLENGVGIIYAMVENAKNSTATSKPVKWEIYYTKSGSPAGEKPVAAGTIPELNPGQLYTIKYNPEDNKGSGAGNYMFRLLEPSSDGSKKDCWSGAVYCIGPIKTTEAYVTLVPNPGKIVVSCKTSGNAPSGLAYEYVVQDVNNNQEVKRGAINAGGSFTVQVPPGSYQVTQVNNGGALSTTKTIAGDIQVGPGQTVYQTFTNRFPIIKGTLNITAYAEGPAPEGSTLGITISGPEGKVSRNIKVGQTSAVSLAPGNYEISVSNLAGAVSYRKSPAGFINVKSGQISSVQVVAVYSGQ